MMGELQRTSQRGTGDVKTRSRTQQNKNKNRTQRQNS